MTLARRYFYLLTLVLPHILLADAMASDPPATASAQAADEATGDPADYLKFESRFDATCQLWRADVRLMSNTHPSKTIKYRMVRYLADKRQPSLTVGTIEPGGEPERLGCTMIDGLEQRWEVKQALFTD